MTFTPKITIESVEAEKKEVAKTSTPIETTKEKASTKKEEYTKTTEKNTVPAKEATSSREIPLTPVSTKEEVVTEKATSKSSSKESRVVSATEDAPNYGNLASHVSSPASKDAKDAPENFEDVSSYTEIINEVNEQESVKEVSPEGQFENTVINWITQYGRYKANYSLVTNFKFVVDNYGRSNKDSLRDILGYNWRVDGNNFATYATEMDPSYLYLTQIDEGAIALEANMHMFYDGVEFDDVGWRDVVNHLKNTVPGTSFLDFTFEFPKIKFDIYNRSNFVDNVINFSPNYNFYHEKFEEKSRTTKTYLYPNCYIFALSRRDDNFYNSQITLNNKIRIDDKTLTQKANNEAYFTCWSSFVKEEKELNDFKNIIISGWNLQTLNTEIKSYFPCHVDISFNIQDENNFKKDIVGFLYDDEMMTAIFGAYEMATREKCYFFSPTIGGMNATKNEEIKIWKLFNIIDNNKEYDVDLAVLGNIKDLVAQARAKELLKTKVNSFVEQNNISMQDIFEGKPNYSEILFYKIEKYKKNIKQQEIWFGNYENTISYIDSQINHEETKYIINAFIMVMSNKYSYGVVAESFTKGHLNVSYTKESYPIITEIKIGEYLVRAQDYPPILPDVEFLSLVEKPIINIKIMDKVGTVEEKPIFIFEEDENKFLILKQYLNLNNEMIFKYDNKNKEYEIFRLEFEPKSYSDFAFGRKSIVKNNFFFEKLEEDKTYWYCFRTIDSHENVSNPTKIFKVNLYKENFKYYYKIEIHNLLQNNDIVSSKTLKRHLYIGADIMQLLIKDENTKSQIGIAEETIWNKKIKIRIRSKNSGKVLDLNLNFDKNYINKNENEIEKIENEECSLRPFIRPNIPTKDMKKEKPAPTISTNDSGIERNDKEKIEPISPKPERDTRNILENYGDLEREAAEKQKDEFRQLK